MKTLATFLILFLAYFEVLAASPKTLEIEFTYSSQADGYNLYMDGNLVCTNSSTKDFKLVCNDLTILYGNHTFTMTAFSFGVETLHSPEYLWEYRPEQGMQSPIIINFVAVFDGKRVDILKKISE